MNGLRCYGYDSLNDTVPACGSFPFLKACRQIARYLPTCNRIEPCFRRIKPKKGLGNATLVDLFEVSDILVEKDLVKLRNVSWCMFPTIMRGDILKVKPARVEQMEIGDIAVFRRWGRLYSHRVVDSRQINGESFIFTRPDTAKGGDDGPIGDDNLLGKVSEILRRDRRYSPDKRDFSSEEKLLHFLIHSKIRAESRLKSLAGFLLSNIQKRKMFRLLLFRLFKPLRSRMKFSLGTPTNPQATARFFSYVKLDEVSCAILEKVRFSARWHLVANYKGRMVGYATIFQRPLSCAYPGYWIEDFFIINRYRAAKIGTIFYKQLRDILAGVGINRISVSLLKNNHPGKSFFESLGFRQKAYPEKELKILEADL